MQHLLLRLMVASILVGSQTLFHKIKKNVFDWLSDQRGRGIGGAYNHIQIVMQTMRLKNHPSVIARHIKINVD